MLEEEDQGRRPQQGRVGAQELRFPRVGPAGARWLRRWDVVVW